MSVYSPLAELRAPPAGLFVSGPRVHESRVRRAIAFVDGQSLFHAARLAFGRAEPDYDPAALAGLVAERMGWILTSVRFYTGVPDAARRPFWHRYWRAKLRAMAASGVIVVQRPLRYRRRLVRSPDGSIVEGEVGEEKGIDIRIALDAVRAIVTRQCDVVLLFSQDQDFAELAREVRVIAADQQRWIKIASAYPVGPGLANARGVDRTDWIPLDRAAYEACLDLRDYRQ
jgi:uncharacterized LabA/DUF88 family protein